MDARTGRGTGPVRETAASKMRYQMNRLRRLAASFQLQREASLARHADAITTGALSRGGLQERVHGAAWYFARHGFELAEELVTRGREDVPWTYDPLAVGPHSLGPSLPAQNKLHRRNEIKIVTSTANL